MRVYFADRPWLSGLSLPRIVTRFVKNYNNWLTKRPLRSVGVCLENMTYAMPAKRQHAIAYRSSKLSPLKLLGLNQMSIFRDRTGTCGTDRSSKMADFRAPCPLSPGQF